MRDSGGANDAQSAQPESGSTLGKPKRSGVGRFLSIFNCCMAPSHANAIDPDSAEASRKVTKTRPQQASQATPSAKQEENAMEKTQPNAKERLEQAKETSNFPQNPVTTDERKVPAPAQIEDPHVTNPISDLTSEGVDPNGENLSMDKPLPASPKSPQTSGVAHSPETPPQVHDLAQSSRPLTTISPPTPVISSEEQAISDRTPEQKAKDEDIEMTDAPPTLPLAQKDVPMTDAPSGGAPQAEKSSRVDLPPPPPPTDRQIPPPSLPPEPQTAKALEPPGDTLAVAPEDRKWLLPPLRPEFKGKKCLVLDLDETLVHSSFKVSVSEPVQISLLHSHTASDSPSSRLHYSRRD